MEVDVRVRRGLGENERKGEERWGGKGSQRKEGRGRVEEGNDESKEMSWGREEGRGGEGFMVTYSSVISTPFWHVGVRRRRSVRLLSEL